MKLVIKQYIFDKIQSNPSFNDVVFKCNDVYYNIYHNLDINRSNYGIAYNEDLAHCSVVINDIMYGNVINTNINIFSIQDEVFNTMCAFMIEYPTIYSTPNKQFSIYDVSRYTLVIKYS